MSNNRYTGPKARETMEARREAAADARDILSKSPEEIVNEIVRDLGLDERYYLGSDGRVGTGYKLTTPEERARASQKIQDELIGRCKKEIERTEEVEERRTERQPQAKRSSKRKVRYDRIAAVSAALLLLGTAGFATVKQLIGGVRETPDIGGGTKGDSSVSDPVVPETEPSSQDIPEIAPDVNVGGGDSPYEVPDLNTDEISYVIDFMDYYNPSQRENINKMLDEGMIDGLGIRIGGSKEDYPFTIKDFTDDEINMPLQRYIENGQLELDHNYGLEFASAESYILKAPYTIPYYLTCCINREEAAIEADCIEATYNFMYKDMQGYDFKGRMAPIAIDIENCGDIKLATNEDYLAQIGVMEQRTDAVLYLIDSLVEKGIIDERGVIIYGDLNRMQDKTQINWEALFQGLQERGINTVKWGTRAIGATYNDPRHPEDAVQYESIYAFKDALMNTATNISYMKTYYDKDDKSLIPYLKDVAIQQIHLDQQMETNTYGEKYDINITTKDTLDAIIHGDPIDYSKGFIDRIEDVRMQEVTSDLAIGEVQVENYVPSEYKATQQGEIEVDNGDR